jgi:RecA/RadA recombinase
MAKKKTESVEGSPTEDNIVPEVEVNVEEAPKKVAEKVTNPDDSALEFFNYAATDKFILTINKQLKIEKVTHGADERLIGRGLPTASISLNHFLGRGYLRKKIHMAYGEKSSTKTFLDYATVARLQRLCRNCLGVLPLNDHISSVLRSFYGASDCACGKPEMHRMLRIDHESDYAKSDNTAEGLKEKKKAHMERIGVIPRAYTVAYTSSIEDSVDVFKEAVPSLVYDYISLDSIQGTSSDYVYDKEGHDETMGIDPRKLNTLLRNVMNSFHSVGINNFQWLPAINLISQVRAKIGNTGGRPAAPKYSGGFGLEHQNSLITRFKRISYIGESGQEKETMDEGTYGLRVAYRNEKFKMDGDGTPYFTGEYEVYIRDTNFGLLYGDFNYVDELVLVGLDKGLITQRGAYYYLDGKSYQGKKQLNEAMREDPGFSKKILYPA